MRTFYTFFITTGTVHVQYSAFGEPAKPFRNLSFDRVPRRPQHTVDWPKRIGRAMLDARMGVSLVL